MLSRPGQSLLRPHPTPCRLGAISRFGRLYAPSAPGHRRPGPAGPPQFSCPPSAHPVSPTPESSSVPAPPGLRHIFHRPSPSIFSGSALSCPFAGLASRGCRVSLDAAGWTVAPPKGLLTLGSDAGRFPPTPPACYRASWQLPRTGLAPAGGHELAIEGSATTSTSPPIYWTHSRGNRSLRHAPRSRGGSRLGSTRPSSCRGCSSSPTDPSRSASAAHRLRACASVSQWMTRVIRGNVRKASRGYSRSIHLSKTRSA